MIARIARDTALACLAIALVFFLVKRTLAAPLGVLGGGLLIGLSFWAIRSTVDTLISRRSSSETGRKSPRLALVKFFTRHGIVALVAYGMMVRLHVDPLGVLLGVTSLGIAVGVEALRDLRWRRFL
jgi:ATP synthase I chain